MSKFKENYAVYLRLLGRLREVFLPREENLRGAIRNLLRGASAALYITAGTTLFIALAGVLYGNAVDYKFDFASLVRAAFAVALSGFGASVDVEGVRLSNYGGYDLNAAVTYGAHSGLIFVIAFMTIRRMARAKVSKHTGSESAAASPVHLALGFALFSWLLGIIGQGSITYLYTFDLKPLSLTSVIALFAIAWVAAYRGKISGDYEGSSTFGQVTQWVTKTLTNFLFIYGVLTVIALVIAGISFAIEPVFAFATEPSSPAKLNLPQGQIILLITGTILFYINALFQSLLAAMGLNVGLNLDQASGSYGPLLSATSSMSKSSFWILSDFGGWAFTGVLLLVLVVALISGAAATARTSLTFRNLANFWQALGFGTLVAFGVTYVMNLQMSYSSPSIDGTTSLSAAISLGTTFISVLVISTLVLALAFLASGRIFDFVASAFPTLTVRLQRGVRVEERMMSGRVFGYVVKLTLVAVALTPITAATTNRVWSLTDGPTQVGQSFANNLQSMKISDLKKYINPKGTYGLKWLSDKVLTSAQPKDGYSVSTEVTNFLDKPWAPGNLDATVKVVFVKGSESFTYTFDNESKLSSPSWLIQHVDYKPILSPGTLSISANSFLPKAAIDSITVNGEKVKVGSYYSIPGAYTVKADGYKLIAPTTKTFYSSQYDSLKIGYGVKLPDGASAKLNSAILEKAKDCFAITLSGSSKCVVIDDLTPTVTSGEEPATYFDYVDSGYKSTEIECSANRTDTLTSADHEKSTSSCSSLVTFTRTFFTSQPKRVPKYTISSVCEGAMISDYWMTDGERLDYYDGWNGWGYYDSNDYWIAPEDYHWDDCYSTRDIRVQDGYETIQVRGSKIATVSMSSTASKKLTVIGALKADGSFSATK